MESTVADAPSGGIETEPHTFIPVKSNWFHILIWLVEGVLLVSPE